jgi:formate dehydrogenase major subunit
MGSNMAENHPVGFQWVVEGQQNGARVYHVDPRFTRTSALADAYVPLRAGTDIAFLGGIIHEILEREADFREYVLPYTNASHIISEDVRLPEDLSGVFSGFDEEAAEYDDKSWQYEGEGLETVAAAGTRAAAPPRRGRARPQARRGLGARSRRGGRRGVRGRQRSRTSGTSRPTRRSSTPAASTSC